MFLGIDLGSSSIKLSLYDPLKGHTVGSISHPKIENHKQKIYKIVG